MKNKLLLHLLLMCAPLLTCAQTDSADAIYLKNGSVYRGKIIEKVPGQTYRIVIMGGSQIVIKNTDVDRVTREPAMKIQYSTKDSDDVIYLKNGAVYVGDIFDHRDSIWYKIETTNRHIFRFDTDEILKVERVPEGTVENYRPHRNPPALRLEADLSYRIYFYEEYDAKNHVGISHMSGISLTPEIQSGKVFSFLTGLSVQMNSVKNHYARDATNGMEGNVEKGYMTRFAVPLWFRFTKGKNTKVFFQLGLAAGCELYQGWGYTYYPGPLGAGGGHSIYGRVKFAPAFVNVCPMGVGLRKNIAAGLEIISYLEGGACNFEINDGSPYQPYFQLHLGFNFTSSRHKPYKRQP